MHSMVPVRFGSLLVLAVLPATMIAGARQAPVRVLDRPEVELAEPFTDIGSVRELSDGRVILVDDADRLVHVVDLKAGTVSQVGRQGGGPAEYRVPGVLLAARGDTTLLTDGGNRRLLAIGPDATPVAVLTDAWPMGTGKPGTRLPRAMDGRGRGYFLGSAVNVRQTGAVSQLDSAALLRAARGSATDDTIGYVHMAPRRISMTEKNGTLTSVTIVIPPYPAQDSWQVFADGAVAIARVHDYRVDWVLPDGARLAGRPIAFSPIRITQRDKDAWAAARARPGAAAAGRGAPSAASFDWPELKPPFPPNGAMAGSDGRLWVQRHTVAGDSRSRYDVIDRRGVVVSRVEIPSGGRIVGFGTRSIYVARKDADDLQYLQRFAL